MGVASFRATAASAAPPSLLIRTQPSASARNGIPLGRQPVIQLRDSQGNDVAQAGVQVTAAIGSGGGELGGTRQVSTDASGRATFTDLSISGAPGSRTLIFTAPGYAQATSSEIVLEAIGTSTSITGASPDPSGAGTPITVSFRVSSQGPIPTGSVTVSDGVQGCSGALVNGAGSCQLSLTTVGQRTLTATYAGGPGLLGSSATEPHTVTAAAPPPLAPTTTTITSDMPDPSVAGSSFTVNFQVTSPGGTPTGTVTVSANNGPSCTGTLNGGSGSCQLTLNNQGDRTLTATYSGGPGFSGSTDSEPHRVDPRAPANEEPFADFNWHCEGLTCFFTDNSRDDNGNETITSRHWDFGDGTPPSNELNPSHSYATPRTYTVTLTVTDNSGASDVSTDDVDPEELEIRRQPSSSASSGVPFERQPVVRIVAGGEDRERSAVTIRAELASGAGTLGGTVTATTDGDGRAEFTNLSIDGAPGSYTLRFTAPGFASVISEAVNVGLADSDIEITAFNPEEPIVGEPVSVAFRVTGDGGTPTGTVTVKADGQGETCTGTVAEGFCSLTFTTPGDRDVTATYGGDGRFGGSSFTEDIQVDPAPPANQAPVASFTFTCPDLTCSFDASGSDDPDGTVSSYSWDFGDGTPLGSGVTTSHPYTSARSYEVTLVVTDNAGATTPVTQTVVVPEPAPGD